MRRHPAVGILTLGVGLLLSATPSVAQSFSFTSIDVPCSAAPPTSCPNGISRRSNAGGINPAGDIVGNYTDGVGKMHGFVLSRGQFTTIDVPGSLVGVEGTLPTAARGSSPSGEIVGQFNAPYNPPASTSVGFDSPAYCPAPGSTACTKGFLYSRGKFSVVLFPGHPGAIPGRITPDGNMYGCLHDFDVMGSMFSAAWTRFGDTSIAAGGGALSDPTLSFPDSMHGGATPDGGTVVGFYGNSSNGFKTTHGYVLQNGVLATYDVPGSISTTIWDINPGEEAVGTFTDKAGKQHGFIQFPDGLAPITLDVPNTPPFNAVRTVILGINPGGLLVGQYTDTNGHTHGFLAMPTSN
jgi:hypothetical protein